MKENYLKNKSLQVGLEKVAKLLEIKEEQLSLIMDITSSNPFRIFRMKDFDISKLNAAYELKDNLQEERLMLISTVLNCSPEDTKKLSKFWLQNYSNILQGKKYAYSLARNVLGIDPMLFHLLKKMYYFSEEQVLEFVMEFLKSKIKGLLLQNYPFEVPRLNARDNFLKTFNTIYTQEVEELLEEGNKADVFFECPFVQDKSRHVKDVKSFIELWLSILEIIECKKPDVFIKLFYNKTKLGTLLWKVAKGFNYKFGYRLQAMLDVFTELEKYLKTKNDITSGAFEKIKYLFPTVLLFTGAQIDSEFKYKDFETEIDAKDLLQSQGISDLFERINSAEGIRKKMKVTPTNLKNLLPNLLRSGFFDKFAAQLFSRYDVPHPSHILGIIIGMVIDKRELVKENLLSLVGDKHKQAEGLLALLSNDTTQQSIKIVFKQLNLDSRLGMNLLELTSPESGKDKYSAALNIWKKYWSNPNLVAAFVALFNGEISNVRLVADKLGDSGESMLPLVAFATKRLDYLDHEFKILSEKLKINNTDALKTLACVAKGEFYHYRNLWDRINKPISYGIYWSVYAVRYLIDCALDCVKNETPTETNNVKWYTGDFVPGIRDTFLSEEETKLDENNNQQENDNANKSEEEKKLDMLRINYMTDVFETLAIIWLKPQSGNSNKAVNPFRKGIVDKLAEKLEFYFGNKNSKSSISPVFKKAKTNNKNFSKAKWVEIIEKFPQRFYRETKLILEKYEKEMFANAESYSKICTESDSEFLQVQALTQKFGCTFNVSHFCSLKQVYYTCNSWKSYFGGNPIIWACCAENCHANCEKVKCKAPDFVACRCGKDTFITSKAESEYPEALAKPTEESEEAADKQKGKFNPCKLMPVETEEVKVSGELNLLNLYKKQNKAASKGEDADDSDEEFEEGDSGNFRA